jgi:hypothetical protein
MIPPIKEPLVDLRTGLATSSWYTAFEEIDPEIEGGGASGSGTARNYDVGTSGARVPLLNGGDASEPNIWSGSNLFTQPVKTNASYQVLGVKVVGVQEEGWTALSGTAQSGGGNTYTAPVASVAYSQAEMQAVMDALQEQTRISKALVDMLLTHGLIGD